MINLGLVPQVKDQTMSDYDVKLIAFSFFFFLLLFVIISKLQKIASLSVSQYLELVELNRKLEKFDGNSKELLRLLNLIRFNTLPNDSIEKISPIKWSKPEDK